MSLLNKMAVKLRNKNTKTRNAKSSIFECSTSEPSCDGSSTPTQKNELGMSKMSKNQFVEKTKIKKSNSWDVPQYRFYRLMMKDSSLSINMLKILPSWNCLKIPYITIVSINVTHINRNKLIKQLFVLNGFSKTFSLNIPQCERMKIFQDTDMLIMLASEAIITDQVYLLNHKLSKTIIKDICIPESQLKFSIIPEYAEIISDLIENENSLSSFDPQLKILEENRESKNEGKISKFTRDKSLNDIFGIDIKDYLMRSLITRNDLAGAPYFSKSGYDSASDRFSYETLAEFVLRRYIKGLIYTSLSPDVTLCMPTHHNSSYRSINNQNNNQNQHYASYLDNYASKNNSPSLDYWNLVNLMAENRSIIYAAYYMKAIFKILDRLKREVSQAKVSMVRKYHRSQSLGLFSSKFTDNTRNDSPNALKAIDTINNNNIINNDINNNINNVLINGSTTPSQTSYSGPTLYEEDSDDHSNDIDVSNPCDDDSMRMYKKDNTLGPKKELYAASDKEIKSSGILYTPNKNMIPTIIVPEKNDVLNVKNNCDEPLSKNFSINNNNYNDDNKNKVGFYQQTAYKLPILFIGCHYMGSLERFYKSIEFLLCSSKQIANGDISIENNRKYRFYNHMNIFLMIIAKIYDFCNEYPLIIQIFTLTIDSECNIYFKLDLESFLNIGLIQDLVLFAQIFIANLYQFITSRKCERDIPFLDDKYHEILKNKYEKGFLFEKNFKSWINTIKKSKIESLAILNIEMVTKLEKIMEEKYEKKHNDDAHRATELMKLVQDSMNKFIEIMTGINQCREKINKPIAIVKLIFIPSVDDLEDNTSQHTNNFLKAFRYVQNLTNRISFDPNFMSENTSRVTNVDVLSGYKLCDVIHGNAFLSYEGFLDLYVTGSIKKKSKHNILINSQKIISLRSFEEDPKKFLSEMNSESEGRSEIPSSIILNMMKQLKSYEIVEFIDVYQKSSLYCNKRTIRIIFTTSRNFASITNIEDRIRKIQSLYPNAMEVMPNDSIKFLNPLIERILKDSSSGMTYYIEIMKSFIMKIEYRRALDLNDRVQKLLLMFKIDTENDKILWTKCNDDTNSNNNIQTINKRNNDEDKTKEQYMRQGLEYDNRSKSIDNKILEQKLAIKVDNLINKMEQFLSNNGLEKIDYDKLCVLNKKSFKNGK